MRAFYLLTTVCLIVNEGIAQRNNNVIAIVNDPSLGNANMWMNISEVNPKSGQIQKTLFDRNRTSYALYDGTTKTKTQSDQIEMNGQTVASNQYPTATMVAAAALDVRHNRLFLTPMQIPELRWVDLDDNNTTLKTFCLKLPFLSSQDLKDPANHITRMSMNSDGYGYALTNDANHLIRFTSGKKITANDLGPISDDGNNPTVSIHNKCSSYGGDMIADKNGNLYVISAYHAIFKVNIPTRSASYIGNIKGLPANYTTNGAAVTAEGDLIVTSANSNEGYYKVDLTNWEAVKITGDIKVPPTSDLASPYFAFESKSVETGTQKTNTFPTRFNTINTYPNPVTDGIVRISFDNRETGRYSFQLVDFAGRMVLQKEITICNQNQLVELEVPKSLSGSNYLISIKNANGKNVYTDKLIVE